MDCHLNLGLLVVAHRGAQGSQQRLAGRWTSAAAQDCDVCHLTGLAVLVVLVAVDVAHTYWTHSATDPAAAAAAAVFDDAFVAVA